MKNNKYKAFSLRLETEEYEFLRKRAQMAGVSLAEYLRKLVLQGVISETAEEISARMSEIGSSNFNDAVLFGSKGRETLFHSIFTIEEILKQLAGNVDLTKIQTAQAIAHAKTMALKGGVDGK